VEAAGVVCRDRFYGSEMQRGVTLNQKVKNLIQQLGEAIHETICESEDVAGVVKDIRAQGFDVMLMLEATIGLNEVEAEPTAEVAESGDTEGRPFTQNDLHFLKSLRIALPLEEATAAEDEDEAGLDCED
jgi:hypothetical protein